MGTDAGDALRSVHYLRCLWEGTPLTDRPEVLHAVVATVTRYVCVCGGGGESRPVLWSLLGQLLGTRWTWGGQLWSVCGRY